MFSIEDIQILLCLLDKRVFGSHLVAVFLQFSLLLRSRYLSLEVSFVQLKVYSLAFGHFVEDLLAGLASLSVSRFGA